VVTLDGQFRESGNAPYRGNVIYLSTFSKTLSPGIRLAWVIAPQEVIRKLVQAKQGADLHTATFNQIVAFEVSRGGFLDRHVWMIRRVYGERCNVMLGAMEEFFPEGCHWTRPQGGLFLWGILPEGMNSRKVLEKAIEQKVAFVPGDCFYARGGGVNTMRLNFSFSSPEVIRLGIER
jgi:2-aminoadipate transaminase